MYKSTRLSLGIFAEEGGGGGGGVLPARLFFTGYVRVLQVHKTLFGNICGGGGGGRRWGQEVGGVEEASKPPKKT